MLIVTPVINLQGNCKEAIRLYEKAFETKAEESSIAAAEHASGRELKLE